MLAAISAIWARAPARGGSSRTASKRLISLGAQSKGESAQPRKQVSQHPRVAQPYGGIGGYTLFRILRRLQKGPRRQTDRHAAKRHRHRLRLPHGFGAIAGIEGKAGKPLFAREIERRLGRAEAFQGELREAGVHPLIGQRQVDPDHRLGAMRGDELAQGRNQRGQSGIEDRALGKVDDAGSAALAITQNRAARDAQPTPARARH